MAVLAADTFTRANETPLAGNWSTGFAAGTLNLVANAVAPNNLAQDAEAYYSALVWPNDQYSKAKLTVTGTTGGSRGIGLTVRQSTSARTLYRLAVDHAASNNVDLSRFSAGRATIATFTQAWTDGDTWELRVQGTTLRIFRNDVQVGTDTTDSVIASGSAGIAYSSTETAASLDDWEGGDFAGGGWSLYRPYTLGADISGGLVSGLFYYWRRRKQEKPDE